MNVLLTGNHGTGKELTDTMIEKLSLWISAKQELQVLATNGLKIKPYIIEAALEYNQYNVQESAQRILLNWRKEQPNKKIAYSKLRQVLENVNMAFYVRVVLKE